MRMRTIVFTINIKIQRIKEKNQYLIKKIKNQENIILFIQKRIIEVKVFQIYKLKKIELQ